MYTLNYILKRPVKLNLDLHSIASFFLFLALFFIIVDPKNQIFGLKDVSFILLMVTVIPFLNFKGILLPLILISIHFFSTALGVLIPSSSSFGMDYMFANRQLKSFVFLIFIFCLDEKSTFPVFKYFYYINLFLASIITLIGIIISYNPFLCATWYAFFIGSRFSETLFLGWRSFLGMKVLAVFYASSPMACICLAFSTYKFLNEYIHLKRFKYLLHTLVLFLYLFFAGTRANMLSAMLIVGFVFILKLLINKKYVFFVSLLLLFCSFSLILIFMLLNDQGDNSLNIKILHQVSYWELFESNLNRYIFIGDGAGALFYSKGFNQICNGTELSYYDLIRFYGLFNSFIIVLIFLYPLIGIYNNYKKSFFISIFFGYLAFLFIAGTNPYLIGSTGFINFSVMYYISTHKISGLSKKE